MLIRIGKSQKDKQYNGQQKKDKRQTMIHKTLQRKLKIEQHEARQKLDVNLGGPIKFYVCRTNQMDLMLFWHKQDNILFCPDHSIKGTLLWPDVFDLSMP